MSQKFGFNIESPKPSTQYDFGANVIAISSSTAEKNVNNKEVTTARQKNALNIEMPFAYPQNGLSQLVGQLKIKRTHAKRT